MDYANWYFTHEGEEDRLWYQIFFSMCRKFAVLWPTATAAQKSFIEEITRVNYERELTKREMRTEPIRGFFDESVSA